MTPQEFQSAKQLAVCSGKEAYNSKPLADKIAKRRNRGDRRLTVYHCPFCRHWHMGGFIRNPRR